MSGDNEIKTILNDPGTSYWLKNALASALDRDLVNAGNDAKLLAMVLERRADQVAAKPVEKNLPEKKEKSAYDLLINQLVEVKAEDVTLKFIFDNIKNHAVAGTFIVVGFHLFPRIELNSYFNIHADMILLVAEIFASLFLLLTGVFLTTVNFILTGRIFFVTKIIKNNNLFFPFLVILCIATISCIYIFLVRFKNLL